MKVERPWILPMGVLLLIVFPVSAREWTDSSGRYSVEAELVEVKEGSVSLKKSDGKVVGVPLTKLSNADREYLSLLAKTDSQSNLRRQSAKYESPKAVLAALVKAGRDRDYAAVLSCYTPRSHEIMAGALVVQVITLVERSVRTGAAENEAARAQIQTIEELFAKHGLTQDWLAKIEKVEEAEETTAEFTRISNPIDDKAGFTAELMQFIEETLPKEGRRGKPSHDRATWKLVDLEVKGDTATGVHVRNKQDGTKVRLPMGFKKIEGGWLLDYEYVLRRSSDRAR